MDHITTEFSQINLEAATLDVKKSDPSNKDLQKCLVSPSVGGGVDGLVGITLNSSFPELVHMMDCGLAIYKCKLASHDRQWNALIGGSHESFEIMSNKTGSTNILLANFMDGLKRFRACGPPKLSGCQMTVQEELFAKVSHAKESEI